jgi:hypothetical protein
METCPLLISMVSGECINCLISMYGKLSSVFNVLQEESCSLYPDEIECFYGDAYLCKVQGRDPVDFDDLPAFDVLSVCCEVGVVNMFFDEFIPDVDKFVSIIMFYVNVLFIICYCNLYSDLLIVPQIDVPTCDSIKELEDYGFNHYSYVGSNNSDDAADEYVNAVIADDNVVGEVSIHACKSWYQLVSMYAMRFSVMLCLLFVGWS